MSTWLNMADWVLCMARCRSFWKERRGLTSSGRLRVKYSSEYRLLPCWLQQCPPKSQRHPQGGGARGRGVGCVRSLTIMFSRAYLASQQFRNTGMNKFRKGGQNIYESKSYSQKNPRFSSKKAINSQFEPCREGSIPKLSSSLCRGCRRKRSRSPRCSRAAEKGGQFWG